MIDTHAHIDDEVFDIDRDEMIERAHQAGIEKIIIPATELNGYQKILEISENHQSVYCAIGIHPHNSSDIIEPVKKILSQFLSQKKVVAVGEIGLDYYYDFSPKEQQKRIFKEQIEIAKEYKLPVIVHNRESDDDLIKILKDEQDGTLRGVMHCFSGDKKLLDESLELDFNISFTGNITFKKTNLSSIVDATPIDRIMLETDSPYMTPVPFRGKRNEPSFIRFIAEKISEIKKITINEVINMTSKNAKQLFNLSLALAFFIIFIFSTPGISLAQSSQDEEFKEIEKIDNPYHKGLGFGFDIGNNTIVETQYYQNLKKSVSFEGIFFWGATINYAMLEYLYLEATYAYSKNTKVIEKSKGTEGPNINQVVELSSLWLVNPRSRITFYGIGGLSFFHDVLNKGRYFQTSDSPLGFNFGLGFRFNQPISNAGILNVVAEWRLNWAPTKVHGKTFWTPGEVVDIVSTKFFSMPRLTIIFYPAVFNSLSLDK